MRLSLPAHTSSRLPPVFIKPLPVVTAVGKARGLPVSRPAHVGDGMTAVVGMETDRAISPRPSHAGTATAAA